MTEKPRRDELPRWEDDQPRAEPRAPEEPPPNVLTDKGVEPAGNPRREAAGGK